MPRDSFWNKKIKPSDLDRISQRLLDEGRMPKLEDLLDALEPYRKEWQANVERWEKQQEKRKHRKDRKRLIPPPEGETPGGIS